MFRHLDHMVSLVGPEHVGIGLDYVEDPRWLEDWIRSDPDAWPPNRGSGHAPTRFARPEQLPELTALMVRHGYEDAAIAGILGANFLRVAGAVWT
jgi:membrane dipeptidase